MSLSKRGSVWWIDFVAPGGTRVRRSAETGNRAQAQELQDQLRADAWRIRKLGDRPRRIWQDAAERWLLEQAHKATHEEDKSKLRWLDRHLADRELESINRALIDTITEAKRAEGCSGAQAIEKLRHGNPRRPDAMSETRTRDRWNVPVI